jgi:chromosome segregation ATPase
VRARLEESRAETISRLNKTVIRLQDENFTALYNIGERQQQNLLLSSKLAELEHALQEEQQVVSRLQDELQDARAAKSRVCRIAVKQQETIARLKTALRDNSVHVTFEER